MTEWDLVRKLTQHGYSVLVFSNGFDDRKTLLATVRTSKGGKLYPATVDGLQDALRAVYAEVK
jgi:hypothetical protein